MEIRSKDRLFRDKRIRNVRITALGEIIEITGPRKIFVRYLKTENGGTFFKLDFRISYL